MLLRHGSKRIHPACKILFLALVLPGVLFFLFSVSPYVKWYAGWTAFLGAVICFLVEYVFDYNR